MAKRTIKRRTNGKKKTLLSRTVVTYRLDDPEDVEEFRKSFIAAFPSLKTYLANVEEIAIAILKAHNLPTTWQDILPYTDNHDDLPTNASYAADILFSIHEVRDFIKKGNAHSAASAALRLGCYIACNDMEIRAGGRESGRTSNARDAKTVKTKARRVRMQEIAKEYFSWKPGTYLTGTQRREVNKIIQMELDPIDRPTSAVLSADALKIGLRKKETGLIFNFCTEQ